MILELAILNLRPGRAAAFETAFREASKIIAASPGYVSHELQRCIETPNRYVLLVRWQSLEAHTVGFRGSEAYETWRVLLHHFYEPLPAVEHFQPVYP